LPARQVSIPLLGIVSRALAAQTLLVLPTENVGPDVLPGQLRPKSGVVEGLVGREVFGLEVLLLELGHQALGLGEFDFVARGHVHGRDYTRLVACYVGLVAQKGLVLLLESPAGVRVREARHALKLDRLPVKLFEFGQVLLSIFLQPRFKSSWPFKISAARSCSWSA
jgi:hypothetical protein